MIGGLSFSYSYFPHSICRIVCHNSPQSSARPGELALPWLQFERYHPPNGAASSDHTRGYLVILDHEGRARLMAWPTLRYQDFGMVLRWNTSIMAQASSESMPTNHKRHYDRRGDRMTIVSSLIIGILSQKKWCLTLGGHHWKAQHYEQHNLHLVEV
ncbi:uncharacterized protein K444DRAFT_423162 [Hyaloscypha bicolor E]|uniref:Uncharacterized protein n=1 Tax=Hyaloscypha bicolor E TaxID=1095630 RepID=A0A2J6T7T1_9HELO|nr:uncharacterized protein K444DRAFT_423162 [Hyaloscypha bicolor E]PMD59080.1 hypothetical protein K444DRAFT_423162 [Hyaloscypha bicolor E]